MESKFLARLPKGEDLLKAIVEEFRVRSIKTGSFTLIGAVTRAVIGFYDTINRQYVFRDFEAVHEIVSCVGNISEKDGQMFAHGHIVIAGPDFQCFGGHLGEGTTIFAAELSGVKSEGPDMLREYDEATGLMLWRKITD